MPKLCKDCRWVNGIFYCNHPNNISLVTGYSFTERAEALRNDNSKCGPEGKWFENPSIAVPSMPLAKPGDVV